MWGRAHLLQGERNPLGELLLPSRRAASGLKSQLQCVPHGLGSASTGNPSAAASSAQRVLQLPWDQQHGWQQKQTVVWGPG